MSGQSIFSRRLLQRTRIVATALLLACACWSAAPSVADELLTGAARSATEESLRSLWAGCRSEISTARVEYDCLVLSSPSATVSAEDLVSWLEEANLAAGSAPLRTFLERFHPEANKADEASANRGETRYLLEAGAQSRRCRTRSFEHVVEDDLEMVIDHPNHDIKAFSRGRNPYYYETMSWFRTTPDDSMLQGGELIELANGDYLVRAQAGEAPVTSAVLGGQDGLPRRVNLVNQGALTRLEYYGDYALFGGDVLCPTVRMRAEVHEGRVGRILLTVIRNAEFNFEFVDEDFNVEAPAGWAWFDKRSDRQLAGVWKHPVSDVAAFFRTQQVIDSTTASRSAPASTALTLRSVLLIVNGLILIVAGVVLWRRT